MDNRKFGAFPIFGDGVVWQEGFTLVLDMALKNELYAKIGKTEDKENGAPFLVPKDRGVGGLVVPWCIEASFKELVGEDTNLG